MSADLLAFNIIAAAAQSGARGDEEGGEKGMEVKEKKDTNRAKQTPVKWQINEKKRGIERGSVKETEGKTGMRFCVCVCVRESHAKSFKNVSRSYFRPKSKESHKFAY